MSFIFSQFGAKIRVRMAWRKLWMTELEVLKERIEALRAELHKLAENRSMQDKELLAVSEILDAAINDYYRLLAGKTASEPDGRAALKTPST
jgi:hypothetical protein